MQTTLMIGHLRAEEAKMLVKSDARATLAYCLADSVILSCTQTRV